VYAFIGFQKITDRYFEGNIQNLLNYYNGSDEAVFEDDAPSFFISNRVSHLKAKWQH
jgi:hypothetical protein